MRRYAKAATAGSSMRRAIGFGRAARGVFVPRAASDSDDGSSAPSHQSPRLVLLVALAFAALAAFVPQGAAAAITVDSPFPLDRLFSFGPDGTEGTDFEEVGAIALDQQDDLVYVLDEAGSEASLVKFDAKGDPVDFEGTNPEIDGNRLDGLDSMDSYDTHINKIAVDSASGVIYVTQPGSILAFEADGDPAKFSAGPGVDTNEIPATGRVKGIAVDSEGSLYVSHIEGNGPASIGKVSIFGSSGAPLTSLAATEPRDVSIAADGIVYVSEARGEFAQIGEVVSRLTPSSFPVSGSTTYSATTFAVPSLASSFILSVEVDRSNGDVYVLEGFTDGWIRRYDAAKTLVESFGAPGTPTESSSFKGGRHLAVWEQPHEIAEGEAIKLYVRDQGQVAAAGRKIIIGPPEITNTSALDVTADSAKLRAWVDPNTAETTYYFEYGLEDCATSTCNVVPLGEASVAAGENPVEVSHPIFPLQAATTYHYRVVAENEHGPPVVGPSRIFTTQLPGLGFEITDDRAWEMVSPPSKFGGRIKPPYGSEGGHLQAAANGDSLLYNTYVSIEASPEGNRAVEDSSVLARRDGAGGWRSKDITPPHTTVTPLTLGGGREYKLFSPNLERSLLEPRDATPHSAQSSERTPYLRENDEPAIYTPLVTGAEGFANVPPGAEFGGNPKATSGDVTIAGASPDLSHVLLNSATPLVAGAASGSLYEWSAGQLSAASVLPASEGGATVAGRLGGGSASLHNAVSDDGSRIFWSTSVLGNMAANSMTGLYLRDMDLEETVRLDIIQTGLGDGKANPVFQGASADGTVAFFTDSRRLTEDAGAEGRDLYRCEITVEGGELECELTNLTTDTASAEESAEVQGLALGISEDGTRAYFVAKGVLDTGPNAMGDGAVSGHPNLYAWQQGSGARFIASLSGEDANNWADGLFKDEAAAVSAAAAPSGRYLAFMSQRALTGYENRDVASGEPAQEVFRYDALTDELICASCNPTGASPAALLGASAGKQLKVDPLQHWDGEVLAATLPEATRASSLGLSFHRTRAVHDNGRLFFNAADSLVPADSNGQWDVYQYEPTGLGDCSASSGGGATAPSAGGCVSLISSGADEEESAFLDASVGGSDVFFYTSAQLSVTDEDQEVDVYDARVNGVPAKLTPNAECLGEACQPPASAPNDSTPASATFKGQGNPKPAARKRCAKGKRVVRRKGKARCVVRKQARKGKASKGRRASR